MLNLINKMQHELMAENQYTVEQNICAMLRYTKTLKGNNDIYKDTLKKSTKIGGIY